MTAQVKSLCFVAGRSGGHIIPALTLAHQAQQTLGTRCIFISTKTSLDQSILRTAPWIARHEMINLPNIPYNPFKLLLFIPQFFWACIQAFNILRANRPERIISMGGYISIPVCLMGFLLHIPIDIYELNAEPGKSTTFLARIATRVFVCFEQVKKYFRYSVERVDYPIRFDVGVKNIFLNT